MAFALGTPEILMLIIVPILMIFVIREVVCWYLKINKRVELMKEQNVLLQSMLIEMSKTAQSIQDLSKEKETVKPETAPTKQEPASTMPDPVVSVKKASPKAVKEKPLKEKAEIVETPIAEKKQPTVKKVRNPYGFDLTQEEQEQVEEFIKRDMFSGEQVVINKRTRKVAQFGIENWKSVDPTEWFILFEKP